MCDGKCNGEWIKVRVAEGGETSIKEMGLPCIECFPSLKI